MKLNEDKNIINIIKEIKREVDNITECILFLTGNIQLILFRFLVVNKK